jgi:NhaA family Na+:H+ antiporter
MARRTHVRIPMLGRALAPVGSDFVALEVLGGVALLGATIAALVWTNVAATSYAEFWHHDLTVGVGTLTISEDLLHWVNDGLMTVFFFVVGLEIKRELVRGELRDRRTASLPILAAIGGMVVPALIYAAINVGGAGSRGWAIPMATDIAFAVVVIAILGARVPAQLKLFLLTLAIVDDIGAIIVIATFYSDGIAFGWLAGAGCAIGAIVVMQRLRYRNPAFYVLPAFVLWVCTLQSGVHATIAGVVLGLLTPARPFGGHDLIEHLEARIHPWSSFLVIPLFALANAGVNLELTTIEHAATSPIAWGVVAGLVVGKPLGIMAATSLGILLRLGRLPIGVSFRHIFGAACLAGIGFTVSLFVAELSFHGVRLSEAKTGILVASLLGAALGLAWLLRDARTRSSDVGAQAQDLRTTPIDRRQLRTLDGAGAHTRDQLYAPMGATMPSGRRSLRRDGSLLGLLIALASLEIVTALRTGDPWWGLGVPPLLLGCWIVARIARRRNGRTAELHCQSELHFGPHAPSSGSSSGNP